jgi:hypothetical protein
MDNNKVLQAKVTLDDGLQSMPALKEGFAEFGIVH